MILNNNTPVITINPGTYQVYVNGELVEKPPEENVPMSQEYFLF